MAIRLALAMACLAWTHALLAADTPAAGDKVSYLKDVLPIMQAQCQGCHQPAKASGGYDMLSFDKLLGGGESGDKAIVPGQPDKSNLLKLITSVDGKAEMPEGKPALVDRDVQLIRRWIAQGAIDDSPATAKVRYDNQHPPKYTRPPVVPSIDYSPDGKLLAVAGFHEVLLHNADGTGIVGRLIGMAERIENVKFSPDGKRLAVAGGLPSRVGELQIWNVADRKLERSISVTFDTIYGSSWSPDGKLVAVGCSDNSVRAFDVAKGEQVLFMGSHTDWVQDTVFSVDGSHLMSVSRDRTAKLTEVATQRFNDNITSITPGALKGGMQAVTRHPQRDEIVVGGSDGVPKVYRVHRLTKRVIGDDANLIANLGALRGRVFEVDVSADGKRIVAVSSLDNTGEVGIYDYDSDTAMPDDIRAINSKVVSQRSPEEVTKLEKFFHRGFKQLAKVTLPTGLYAVTFAPDGKTIATAGGDGTIRLLSSVDGKTLKEFAAAKVDHVEVVQQGSVDFIRDVNPVLTKLGCNAGTCHGAKDGKNGFKLSLRGYDAIYDVRAFTDDHASRRANVASPDNSLMLLKATASAPHMGGQLMKPGEPYYNIVRNWIAQGAQLNLAVPRVVSIDVQPKNPALDKPGQKVQMKVVATYADGKTRDVTREAFVESGNADVATHDNRGELTAVRRGEAPILARYEGAYAASILTVMGDRSGFAWQDPPKHNKIDELTAAKWKQMKILPSELCTDADFIRRVTLDLTGLPPTIDDVRAFLADARETRVKRDALIDRLVGSDPYVEHWTSKWADLLQVNPKFLGAEGAKLLRSWIHDRIKENQPYDQFTKQILTANGSNKENPAASYYKILRDPFATMENTTHLFLGVRFNCNKCHDHPFERWTQDQYYQTAAYFARFDLKADPASGTQLLGQTAVEKGKPLYEIVFDKNAGEVKHDRTSQDTAPKFPFDCQFDSKPDASRREQLAAWTTSPNNPYFARSYVNRLWGYLLGVGIMEPIDDLRAGNPPTNPELLSYLTDEFVRSKFNVQEIVKQICKSRTYQLSIATNRWNEDDRTNYSHAIARRLSAEVLFDAIHSVTGAQSKLPGYKPGTRAAELPEPGTQMAGAFLQTFGRPARESACECERTSGVQLGPVMALISGPVISDAIADGQNVLAKLAKETTNDKQVVDELFMRVLNRPATEKEVQAALKVMQQIDPDHQQLAALLAYREKTWAVELAKLEKQRADALVKAQADLKKYSDQIAPAVAKAEADRKVKLAASEKSVKDYETDLPKRLADWEKSQKLTTEWTVVMPKSLKASNGADLKIRSDGSVFASGKGDRGVYTINFDTTLTNITGFRLEALTDERLPNGGPGRSKDGNFVLNEFDVQAGELGSKTLNKVELAKPTADYTQPRFNAAQLIDGTPSQVNGWAISPRVGQTHWVTFELKQPLKHTKGTTFSVVLQQNFNQPDFMLGRFRLSVSTSKTPLGLGLPHEIVSILGISAADRDPPEQERLAKFYTGFDNELQKRREALAEAKQPLPRDSGLVEREQLVAELSKVTPVEPQLAQLREDVKMSAQQLTNRRLTSIQDLTWALINSPAFLFNH